MDDVTRAVRAMYEAWPYPAGAPTMRVSSDVRMLLSEVQQRRATKGPLRALDAGCGRGVDAIALATLQRDVQFTAVDMNRVGLAEARREAERRGLKNLTFAEVDLMTLEGLAVPPGGYDVIFSSGVLHHLSNPSHGLDLLRGVLAPHGVIVLMVYGRSGREPLYRAVKALDALAPRDRALTDRLAAGRVLARAQGADALRTGPWRDLATVGDVEFVDRYLNVNETSYDVRALWSLLDGAGLQFLRWCSPDEWDLDRVLGDPEARALAASLDAIDRYALVDALTWRPRLELLVTHRGNGLRAPLDRAQYERATFVVSPEVAFDVRTRNVGGAQRTESVRCTLGAGESVELQGPLAIAALLLRDQCDAFRGDALITQLGRHGMNRDQAAGVVGQLLARGLMYAPQV